MVPPLLFGGIVYGLVGLVPSVSTFWKFLFVLVLFNLTTASVVLLISVACESTSVGNLVGTLVMLFKYVAYQSPVRFIAHGFLQLVVHWSPYQSRQGRAVASVAAYRLVLPRSLRGSRGQ